MSILDTLADNIRHMRKDRGYTQEELAKRSGLHMSHIARIEGGRQNISIAVLERIAEALGVEFLDLFASDALTRIAKRSMQEKENDLSASEGSIPAILNCISTKLEQSGKKYIPSSLRIGDAHALRANINAEIGSLSAMNLHIMNAVMQELKKIDIAR